MNDEQMKQARLLADKVLRGIKDWPVDQSQAYAVNHKLGVLEDHSKLVNFLIDVEEKQLDIASAALKSTRAWAVLNRDGTPDAKNIWPTRPSKWVKEFHQKNGFDICRITITCDPDDIMGGVNDDKED